MKEGGGMGNVGRHLLERLQPLAAHRRLEIREACDIVAGPRETRHVAPLNRIIIGRLACNATSGLSATTNSTEPKAKFAETWRAWLALSR